MIEFELPDELIAQQPVEPRDLARMLVYDRATGLISDAVFSELNDYLVSGSRIVANNSRVEHCRLLFNDAKTEIFIVEAVNDQTVRALVRPGKKFKLGRVVELDDNVTAEVTAIDEDGLRTIQFSASLDDPRIEIARHVPLPPYIEQNDELAQLYQTVYAKSGGSKAAPTAGLHFTNELMGKVKNHHDWSEVTLEVGLGTFAPLTDDNLRDGRLHSERFWVDGQTLTDISDSGHVTAVGTTSARTLEAIFSQQYLAGPRLEVDSVADISGSTDILIQPGYDFKRVDSLITNFHLPGTSLLLLVESFIGSRLETQRIYDYAIAEKYRFYSFGDCMLIL